MYGQVTISILFSGVSFGKQLLHSFELVFDDKVETSILLSHLLAFLPTPFWSNITISTGFCFLLAHDLLYIVDALVNGDPIVDSSMVAKNSHCISEI